MDDYFDISVRVLQIRNSIIDLRDFLVTLLNYQTSFCSTRLEKSSVTIVLNTIRVRGQFQ